MEVHHHSHNPKKWKEYLTEFLMLFLAVSMGFIAENLREKHIENERSEELMHAFINDVKENQKQLDSLIINNQRLSYYYDSMVFDNGFGKRQIDLIKLSDDLDFTMYRFINKKTIFEQMKSSGALRYIQDKEILKSMLRYEENADYAERRSMDNETDHYNNRFRTTMDEILPLSFYKYISEDNFKTITKMDSLVNPGRYENYKIYGAEIKKDLENTKFTKEQPEKWRMTFDFFKVIDKQFKKLVPDAYLKQHTQASMTHEYQILDTAFSTATINYNWQTALHRDAGDYEGGFGNLCICVPSGKYIINNHIRVTQTEDYFHDGDLFSKTEED